MQFYSNVFRGLYIGGATMRLLDSSTALDRGNEWEQATLIKIDLLGCLFTQLDLFKIVPTPMRIAGYTAPLLVGFYCRSRAPKAGEEAPLDYRVAHKTLSLLGPAIAFTVAATTPLLFRKNLTAAATTLGAMATYAVVSSSKVRGSKGMVGVADGIEKIILGGGCIGAILHGDALVRVAYALIGYGLLSLWLSPYQRPDRAPQIEQLEIDDEIERSPSHKNLLRGVGATRPEAPEGVSLAVLEEMVERYEDDPVLLGALKGLNGLAEAGYTDPQAFFRDGLRAYRTHVENNCNKENAELLATYALLITQKIDTTEDEELRRSCLIDLAACAHECETSWLGVSRLIVHERGIVHTSIEELLLTQMAVRREKRFKQVVHDLVHQHGSDHVLEMAGRLIDPTRRHNWNRIATLLGDDLGLASYEVAQCDRTQFQRNPFDWILLKRLCKPLKKEFWEHYGEEEILGDLSYLLEHHRQIGLSVDRRNRWLEKITGESVYDLMAEDWENLRPDVIGAIAEELGLLERKAEEG